MTEAFQLFPSPKNIPSKPGLPNSSDPMAVLSSTLQSRARWRNLARQAVDLIFETDSSGHIVMLEPKSWLDHNTSDLVGQHITALWDNNWRFQCASSYTRHVVQTEAASGDVFQALLSCEPNWNAQGQFSGTLGTLVIIPDGVLPSTSEDTATNAWQAPLLPGETHLLDSVIGALRQTILPHIALVSAATNLFELLDCEGALLGDLDLQNVMVPTAVERLKVLHGPAAFPREISTLLESDGPSGETGTARILRKPYDILLTRENIRSRGRIALMLWRTRPWTTADAQAATTICKIFAAYVELDGVHRHLLQTSPFDVTTGLLTWQGFTESVVRRMPRLDREHLAATMMVVRIEGLSSISETRGFEIEEEALSQSVALLSNAVRPSDVMARLSSNVFVFWLDGGDRFAAAERAERITAHGVPIIVDPPIHLAAHIGLVCREPGMTDPPEMFLERALQALNEVPGQDKLWCFSHEAP